MATPKRHRDELAVRDAALAYPEAREEFPWGHRAVKVRRKVFVFMSNDEPDLSLSVKLPWSGEGALQLPCCEPTHYGLGRSGWVTATFGPKDRPDLAMLRSWLDESYRAVAPRKLVAALEAGSLTPARARGRAAPRTSASARRTSRAPPSGGATRGSARSRGGARRGSSA